MNLRRFLNLAALAGLIVSRLVAQTPVAPYDWKPVRVGAGGFVTGMSVHPLNPEVRYARTDVGNGYRWNSAKSEWIPILVRNVEDNTGLSGDFLGPPVVTGVESLQVDPSNLDVVYMSFKLEASSEVSGQFPSSSGALYKSTDRGLTFARSGLMVPMQPNGSTRFYGERIAVDPNNSSVVYYGTFSSGLRASFDGSTTWSQVAAGGPSPSSNVINIVFDPTSTLTVNGQVRSATLYATVINGSVFRSTDGGTSWASISSSTTLDGFAGFTTIGPDGKLHVVKRNTKQLWQYSNNTWTVRSVNPTFGTVAGIAVDQANPNRIFTMSGGGSLCRSLDGGANWVSLSNEYLYANTFAWLPQYPSGFRSNGGVYLDSMNRLWSPQGNEGVLTYSISPNNTETGNPQIKWTIQSQGIEELVGHDVVIPPGSGDKPVISVHDATAFFIDDPDQFTATMAQLQDQLISNGIGLAYCPNAPSYVTVFTSDANDTSSGKNYSGYSADGGRTWTPFGSQPIEYRAGQIAVSRRADWGLGQDRIVILPSQGRLPKYSHDGGQTWTNSTGVDQGSGDSMAEGGMINFSVRQRLLLADPLVANKFYLGSLSGKFYVSIDGGMTWTSRPAAGLAPGRFHAQMEANRARPNDIWYVNGWEGTFPGNGVSAATMRGLFRTNNEGASFQRNPAVEYAICIALGAGSGSPGEADFSVYFYGKLANDPAWGIFRSVDEGASWQRVAFYPAGIFDRPSMIAASWDTFGLLYLTTNGNTAVYGRPSGSQVPQLVSSLPEDQAVLTGASAAFSAQVTNVPAPTYQWQRKNAAAITWEDIPGAVNASYTFISTLADDGAMFRVVATNTNGQSTSREASLLVDDPLVPVFTTSPASQTALSGTTVLFSAAITGWPAPTLQWEIQANPGGPWTVIPGATESSYARVPVISDDGASFRVVATNSQGSTTSAPATLSVVAAAPPPVTGTWTGATSATWQENGNWVGASFPTGSNTAVFAGAGNGNTSVSLNGNSLSLGTFGSTGILFDSPNAAAYTISNGTINTVQGSTIVQFNSTVVNNQSVAATIVTDNQGANTEEFIRNNSPAAALTLGDLTTQAGGNGGGTRLLYRFQGLGSVTVAGSITDNTSGGAARLTAVANHRAGKLTLSGANNFTGVSDVFSDSNNISGGLGGTVVVDYTNNSAVLPNGASVSPGRNGNGNLVFKGATSGTTTITLGALQRFANGSSTITVDNNGGAGTTLVLGATWQGWNASGPGGLTQFDLSSGGAAQVSGGAFVGGAYEVANGIIRRTGFPEGSKVTVKGTDGKTCFATLDGSGNIVAQTNLTTLPVTGAGSAGSWNLNYQVTADTIRTGNAIDILTLRIEGASADQTLDMNNRNMTVSGHILMDGTNNFSIANYSDLDLRSGVIVVGSGKLTMNGTKTSSRELIKHGPGLLEVTGNHSGSTATTSIYGGTYRASSANALTAGNLQLADGVLEVGYDFTRALGTGSGQVRAVDDLYSSVTGNSFGFSAYGGNRTVNLGGSGATVTFGAGNFVASRDAKFLLSSTTSDSTVDFQNPLNLAGDAQTIEVRNGSAAVDARISGIISNGSFNKTGAGTLQLSAANTYSGTTVVGAGTLLINAAHSGSGITSVNPGATLGGTGSLAGPVIAQGTLSPGNAVGTLTLGSTTLSGNLVIEIDGASADKLVSTGVLDIAGSTLTVAELGGGFTQSSHAIATAPILIGTFANVPEGYAVTYTATQAILTKDTTPANDFAAWLAANPPAAGFETDSDNDGLSNGVENLLGTDPNAYSQGLTQLSSTDTTFTFVHSLSQTPASDLTLSYQWSTDLLEWKVSGETNISDTTATITPSAPVAGQVTVTTTVSAGPAQRIFIRLRATRSE